MLLHRRHLGRQNAGGAIEGGKGLIKLRHVPAYRRFALHKVNLLLRVRQRQRCLDTCNAPPDDQHIRVDRKPPAFQFLMPDGALHSRLDQRLGLNGCHPRVIRNPRDVLANVHHVEQVGVLAGIAP